MLMTYKEISEIFWKPHKTH